jgi:hypothetical protein
MNHKEAEMETTSGRVLRAATLLAVLIVPQVVLFGPSLVGRRILLPLDILAAPAMYLSITPGNPPEPPQDALLSDLVLELEIERRFAVSEVRAGRLPLWDPHNYGGHPFLAANLTSVFYPLRVLDYLWPEPTTIAWHQLLKSVLAGAGAYLFFRRALGVAAPPALVGAAAWPLCGFLTLWAGFTISQVAAQLPWMLLCTDGVVRQPRSAWGAGLALATASILVSGHVSIAVEVLLAAMLYAAWRLRSARPRWPPLLALTAAWILGFALSAPQNLPTLEYARESRRIASRVEGSVETPPVGWSALPQIVLPYYYGSFQRQTIYLAAGNRAESPAAAYAGLLATLFLAPLGFAHSRLRRFQLFWAGLGVFGISQVLGLPFAERLFRLPLLDTLRANRFTLLTAWAAGAMAVVGLDVLWRGDCRWRWWFWLPITLVVALGVTCLVRSFGRPPFLLEVAATLRAGSRTWPPPIDTLAGVDAVGRWFQRMYLGGAALCAVALLFWLALSRGIGGRGLAIAAAILTIGETTFTALGVNPQCDPALYYPRIPVLEQLAKAPPGRMCGAFCLPASLNETHGLLDLRGYDSVDPIRMVELLELFRHPSAPPPVSYAAVQWWVPALPSPLADLLGLRYVVTRTRPSHPLFGSGDYWVQENPTALPRVFVPEHAEVVNDRARRLALLGSRSFDPRKVVYLESREAIPAVETEGTAEIASEEPTRVALDVVMRSPGFVMLADMWDPGWKARVGGRETPVLRADHALRAVEVPAGTSRVEFRYEPAGFTLGLSLAAAAAVVTLFWTLLVRRRV